MSTTDKPCTFDGDGCCKRHRGNRHDGEDQQRLARDPGPEGQAWRRGMDAVYGIVDATPLTNRTKRPCRHRGYKVRRRSGRPVTKRCGKCGDKREYIVFVCEKEPDDKRDKRFPLPIASECLSCGDWE